MDRDIISEWFKTLQDSICHGLEDLDGRGQFQQDKWNRAGGGGGRTRVLNSGALIEKGGVNFSGVEGPIPAALKEFSGMDQGGNFFATGVSIVLHPQNPWVPIIHMNVRYFEVDEHVWWFGGGIDVTPHYIIPEQARKFHCELKRICNGFSTEYYPKFKHWADEYFFLPHREETRGIGGIFFDRLNDKKTGKENLFAFVKGIGNSFLPLYSDLAEANRKRSFGAEQKKWQNLRRGRYAEFNLAFDRGTRFGLETGGRTESILMSLPPEASWIYDFTPDVGSEEAQTLSLLRKGIDWSADTHLTK